MAETQGLRNIVEDLRTYTSAVSTNVADISTYTYEASTNSAEMNVNLKRYTGHVTMVYSNRTIRTTISSTRNDTEGYGINSILFLTDGALTSVTCTDMLLSTAISSASTVTAGTRLFLNNASKVKCSSHGSQVVYLNA